MALTFMNPTNTTLYDRYNTLGDIDNFYRQLRLPRLLDRPNHHIGDCTGRIRPYLVDKRKNQKSDE